MIKQLTCGILLLLLLVPILTLTGCELLSGRQSDRVSATSIDLINQTENDLYVLAFTQETLSRVRIASLISIDAGDPGFIASGESLLMPFDAVAGDLESDDTVVFFLYSPRDPGEDEDLETVEGAGATWFQLARMLTLEVSVLEELAFRLTISPDDLTEDDADEIVMADPLDFDRGDWPSGTYNVEKAELEGDVLHLRVSYSGCRESEFALVAWNYFMESYPVQAYALLAHEQGDCEAFFRNDLDFDLTPLKRAYKNSYGRPGTILLSIRDRGETFATVRYEFN